MWPSVLVSSAPPSLQVLSCSPLSPCFHLTCVAHAGCAASSCATAVPRSVREWASTTTCAAVQCASLLQLQPAPEACVICLTRCLHSHQRALPFPSPSPSPGSCGHAALPKNPFFSFGGGTSPNKHRKFTEFKHTSPWQRACCALPPPSSFAPVGVEAYAKLGCRCDTMQAASIYYKLLRALIQKQGAVKADANKVWQNRFRVKADGGGGGGRGGWVRSSWQLTPELARDGRRSQP
jgi:hypothetical protein